MAEGIKTLLTGASAGIGMELARVLSGKGHQVTGLARREARLRELEEEIPGFRGIPLDLKDQAARKAAVKSYLDSQGVPDYLILNAGLAHYGRLDHISWEQVDEQIQVNILSVFDMVQLMLPAMLKAGRGRILIVSSVLGVGWIPYSGTYSATKHAVNAFVRVMRMDLKGTGVSLSALCPGGVQTEFHGVATGEVGRPSSGAEPVDRVVAGMVRQLDRDRAVIYPTFTARMGGLAFQFLPGLMEWVLAGWARAKWASRLPQGRVGPSS